MLAAIIAPTMRSRVPSISSHVRDSAVRPSKKYACLDQRAHLIASIEVTTEAKARLEVPDPGVRHLSSREEYAFLISRREGQRPGTASGTIKQVRWRTRRIRSASSPASLQILSPRAERPLLVDRVFNEQRPAVGICGTIDAELIIAANVAVLEIRRQRERTARMGVNEIENAAIVLRQRRREGGFVITR